jgi:hypothetical protein
LKTLNTLKVFLRLIALTLALVLGQAIGARAAGVTIITHGLNGNVDGWVTGMATNIANYLNFPGTNFACYEMYFAPNGGGYLLTSARVNGSAPPDLDSGEIVVKLDWRQLADGSSYNTYQVASMVVPALLNTNFFPELGGHALAEFPLHLIGHSRGGSLMCEISKQLGTNGVWVDHVTTLDPHPLRDSAFPLDFIYSAVDAPANTYQNVLFADDYWQYNLVGLGGKAVAGAYVRQLTSLSSGGYSGGTGPHSNVHLWYHGTLDWRIPTSDTETNLTIAERTNWWSGYESNGFHTGFLYSRIGGAERTSLDRPLGTGQTQIRDGYNQWWDLGAGVFSNRVTLAVNNGNWPDLILFHRTQTNQVMQGGSTPLRLCYQWARTNTEMATARIYVDNDLNPLNTNQTLLQTLSLPANGAGFVSFVTTNITLSTSNVLPGFHWFYASISGGGRTRYLYAPEALEVAAGTQPPTLDVARLGETELQIGINGVVGQTIILQLSADLQVWQPLATNSLTATNRWLYTNASPSGATQQFFRALLSQ